MQTCGLVLPVFLPKIDLCFISAWSGQGDKAVPAPFDEEEFKQLEGVGCSYHLFPSCPAAVVLRGQARGFPWGRVFWGGGGVISGCSKHGKQGVRREALAETFSPHHLSCSIASKSDCLTPVEGALVAKKANGLLGMHEEDSGQQVKGGSALPW